MRTIKTARPTSPTSPTKGMYHRKLVDASGALWSVWEVDPAQGYRPYTTDAKLPPELERGWLLFESAEERRRCAPIPSAWQTMADAQLLQILAACTGFQLPPRPKPAGPSEFQRRLERARAEGRSVTTTESALCVFELVLGDDEVPVLIFEGSDTYWRVRDYPRNWRELSPAQLLDLSASKT